MCLGNCYDLADTPTTIRNIWQVFVSEQDVYAGVPALLRRVEREATTQSLLQASELETEASIPLRFEAQVRLQPNKLAIQSDTGALTYAELNAHANRQAHALIAAGHSTAEPIALLLDQGAAYISALLGVLKAGHCYVPLDPANPSVRNEQMLEDAGARCIVTHRDNLELARSLAAGRCEVLDVDALAPDAPSHDPAIAVSPDALAYVLYTSGSTGRPKGVMMDHRAVLHNMMRHAQAFDIRPEDRQSLLYTCSVYGGTRDIFNALLTGASLHVFSVKQQGVAGLAQWLKDSGITIYCSVATVFRQFVATLSASDAFPALRLIKLGGEASHRKDIDLYRAHFSKACMLHCGLGSTETGVVRHFFVDHQMELPGSAVPLGYPIPGMEVLLLGEDGKPVKLGEIGEIVIRSRYVARGYWHRPDLNNSVFAPDETDSEARLYRTGDLGVLRSDGCLEHRGRKDFQVKVRGNRVELAEIEIALRDLEGVAHAAVTVRKDRHEQNYLVAYVVARERKLTTSALRAALVTRLPDYMVPSVFVMMDCLPQTPNGKIDRQALPAPTSNRPELAQAYLAPRTGLEAELAALWAELLGVESVGVRDNFFELGGHSLIAVTLMARVRQQYERVLPLATLFKAGTVEKLAELIEHSADQAPTWSPLVPIKPTGTRTPLFCIHPGGGNVLGYNEFVAHLDKDLPVYGLQAHGVVEGQEPQDSIPEMARAYIEAIRDVQPHGPYYLGGESFGGLVAYEMACQLERQGEQVAHVFLGDVWLNEAHVSKWRFRLSALTYFFTLSLGDWRELFSRAFLGRKAPAYVWTKRYTYADDMHQRNSQAHRKAARNFRPRRFSGKVTLFRALIRQHSTRMLQHYYGEAAMNWNRVAQGGTEVHWMPGWHGNMMHDGNAYLFARRLQSCLDHVSGPAEVRRPSVSHQPTTARQRRS